MSGIIVVTRRVGIDRFVGQVIGADSVPMIQANSRQGWPNSVDLPVNIGNQQPRSMLPFDHHGARSLPTTTGENRGSFLQQEHWTALCSERLRFLPFPLNTPWRHWSRLQLTVLARVTRNSPVGRKCHAPFCMSFVFTRVALTYKWRVRKLTWAVTQAV